MLTHNKIFFAEDKSSNDDEEAEDNVSAAPSRDGFGNDDLHMDEKWFHGKQTREQAEALLTKYSTLGDGTFLVRKSENFPGDFTLSFLRQGRVNHCRIRKKHDREQAKFYLIDTVLFDSLYALITYYQTHPLRSNEFFVYLSGPVPQPSNHEDKLWFNRSINRTQAEDMLKRIRFDGAFLV